jgi:poly-gamma-glutamate system protein
MSSIFQTGDPGFTSKKRLYVLALIMLMIFITFGHNSSTLTIEEKQAIDLVRAMHASLWEWVNSPPVRARAAQLAEKFDLEDVPPAQVDPGRTGLIGVEWSEITTTLGPLAAKQAAADPIWTAHILRWFDKTGLVHGDKIMILASGSFPGFLVSTLAAAETRGLQTELTVSLGSSTWGANRMEAPWPLLEFHLRQCGHIKTKSRYYTPGGQGETGGNYSTDAMNLLEEASTVAGVPFLKPVNLNEVIHMKSEEIRKFQPKLLVVIGGSASAAGDSDEIPPPGLISPAHLEGTGRGVVRAALSDGVPVLHLLNVRELSRQVGMSSNSSNLIWQAAGLIVFLAVLITHRRWTWDNS